ncbi:hypothetical protein L2E82_40188 [Cichorium intybus]|uniref:Uncharacterized protein n=1 Tax=Cichorium intybus TaxID=13427 RepID=A0ACB9AL24_CICIN|nr:hypothetical protein L2E82_40188 [Cichorium intybus]
MIIIVLCSLLFLSHHRRFAYCRRPFIVVVDLLLSPQTPTPTPTGASSLHLSPSSCIGAGDDKMNSDVGEYRIDLLGYIIGSNREDEEIKVEVTMFRVSAPPTKDGSITTKNDMELYISMVIDIFTDEEQ